MLTVLMLKYLITLASRKFKMSDHYIGDKEAEGRIIAIKQYLGTKRWPLDWMKESSKELIALYATREAIKAKIQGVIDLLTVKEKFGTITDIEIGQLELSRTFMDFIRNPNGDEK